MDPTQGISSPPPVMEVAAFPPDGTVPYQYQQLYQQHQQEEQQQLQSFWNEQYQEIQNTSDFKNHSLPLARIKKIMKADEDVKMIAAETPVLFARACEMFILELTHRSWAHAEENKRRTLHKNDIAAAITRTDLFDFLVDIVPREDDMFGAAAAGLPLTLNDHMQYYYALPQKREMETSTEIRDWSELIPDALGIIFKDLSLQEKLTVVPCVCKSWGRAVCSPICWQEIDLGLYSRSCTHEKLDRLLRMLIMRSCGSLSKLAVFGLRTDALFSFLADNAGSLQTLIIPGNDISDSIVEQVANRLTNVTTLDLSFSIQIGPKALEAFGKNCKNLTVLQYSHNAPPADSRINQDGEAFAISSTMPGLQRLEVSSLLLTNDGVLKILSNCKKLELLTIERCWKVTLEEKLLKEKYPNVEVLYKQYDSLSDEDYDYQFDEYDIVNDGDSDFEYQFMEAYGLL